MGSAAFEEHPAGRCFPCGTTDAAIRGAHEAVDYKLTLLPTR